MNRFLRSVPRIFAMVCILLSLQALLRAAPDDPDEAENAAPANVRHLGWMGMDENNFDRNFENWVFQGAQTVSGAKTKLNAQLKLRFDELERSCDLSELQKKKLQLAAVGDQRKFFDDVEAVRKKYKELKGDQNAMQQIWQEIQPFQQKLQSGLLHDRSFFAKTLTRTLDTEQLARYRVLSAERRRFQYQSSIDVVLIRLERKVPLKHAQREALRTLILEETDPPLVFGHNDYQVVMFQLSTLPREKLTALLDEGQKLKLVREFAGYAASRKHLVDNGFLAADAPPAPREEKVRRDRRPNRDPADAPADATRPERVKP